MRISDWSSDVCSSDLLLRHGVRRHAPQSAAADPARASPQLGVDQLLFHRQWRQERRRGTGLRMGHRRFDAVRARLGGARPRSEEHTSELQSLMRISYAVFCLKKNKVNSNI